MKKTILIIIFLCIASQVSARNYKSAIVVCNLVESGREGEVLKLDIPFHPYSRNIANHVDLRNIKNLGKEVMAKVSYRIVDYQGIPNEIKAAEGFAGNLGNDFSKLKTDVRYTSKYAVTKADKLATYTDLGVKEEYTGIDSAEITKFCQWSEDVKEIEIIKEVVTDAK